MGINVTKADILLLLDCDVEVIDVRILEKIKDDSQIFYTSRHIYSGHCLYGSCIIWKSQWEKLKGFCECIESYGWEDADLYNRLITANYEEQKILGLEVLRHIDHDNELRWKNFKIKGIQNARNLNFLKENPLVYDRMIIPYVLHKYPIE
jgi:hypothetical protein